MRNLNMKYATDRRATQGLVTKLLTERDQVLALLCRLSGVLPFDDEKPRAVLVAEFCQLLTDYIAAAHFGLYERLEACTERRRPVLDLAAALYPDIAATTELALEFSDKYGAAQAHGGYADLHADLARLGEVLARRIEMEDRLIGALVGPVGTMHAPSAAEAPGVSRETISRVVGLSVSTANHKIARQETLDPLVNGRRARLAAIEKQAEDAFGDPGVARAWLRAENIALGGCTPLSMLDTDIGSREVTKILVAIAHGGVA